MVFLRSFQISSRLRSRGALPLSFIVFLVLIAFAPTSARADGSSSWTPVGPDGGDARAIAAEPDHPNHLYLGTTTSIIYESIDEGATWRRLARLDSSSDLVIDHILVDPENHALLYAAAWMLGRPEGGLWISRDAGHTWTESPGLRGQSVFAFTMAPSNPRMLYAGTLQGVFRSDDAGASWKLISPPGSHEIHEVESLAVDPRDPNIVYAGTWHLPWKTMDGGRRWESIKRGLIVDSDVFSILVDPVHPNIDYLSACSGIYKSEDAGMLFHKIQGIPSEARRTRVLRQDPVHRDTVYAGTTEGLYKTTNGGRTFRRMTGPDIIINDIFIDPANPERVLMATDRSGVLVSTDGGERFEQSNLGFMQRKVQALLVDSRDPSRVYAGVVNDKTFGGAFVSEDGGANWKQLERGLDGRDVFVLAQSPEGAILAGTNSGIFALDPQTSTWTPRNVVANTIVEPATRLIRGKRINIEKQVKAAPVELTAGIRAFDLSGDVWAAATSGGLYTSKDHGKTWQGGPAAGYVDYNAVTSHDGLIVAARPSGLMLSNDHGATWWPLGIPTVVTRIHSVVFSADGTLWLGSREGVYFTRDKGKTWMWIHRLPLVDVSDLAYDPQQGRVLVSSRESDFIYAIDVKTLGWKWYRTGYNLLLVRPAGDAILAASLNDGVVAPPAAHPVETSRK